MDEMVNFTSLLEEYDNSTSMLKNTVKMTDYMEWAIYSYIGIAVLATIVIAWKVNFQIAKFTFFNTTLPFLDIGTDVKAFIVYWIYENHPYWAALTIFWVLVPFILHLVKFFHQLYTCSCTCISTASCTSTTTCTCPFSSNCTSQLSHTNCRWNLPVRRFSLWIK